MEHQPINVDDITLLDAAQRVLAEPGVAASLAATVDQAPEPAVATVPAHLDAQEVDSSLLLIEPPACSHDLGGSLLAQLLGQGGQPGAAPLADAGPASMHADLAGTLQHLHEQGLLQAGQRRGRGGLFACLARMMLAGQLGVALNLDLLLIDGDGVNDGRMDSGEAKDWAEQISGRRHEATLKALFSEGPGWVVQLPTAQRSEVMQALRDLGLGPSSFFIGKTRPESAPMEQGKGRLTIWRDTHKILDATLAQLLEPDAITAPEPAHADAQ